MIYLLTILTGSHAQSNEPDYPGFLHDVVQNTNESFWVRVHAAEALLSNNFQLESDAVFDEFLSTDGAEKIGAYRVMAQRNASDSLLVDSLGREVLAIFHNSDVLHTRLVALETLGKLGLTYPDPEIIEIAGAEEGGIATMAQWVLANSGSEEAIHKLADDLFSLDTLQYRYGAYALRFIGQVPERTYEKMKERYDSMEENHPFRVYLTSALWVHGRPADAEQWLDDLKSYRQGEKYERYELYQSLASRGRSDLSEFIRRGFDDVDTDVKISAAQAALANEHFAQDQIGWLDWVILALYALLLLGIGWGYSFYQKSKEDYFLGGREANPVVTGVSMYVSFFSAISYLAVAGEVIKYGPLMALTIMSAAPVIFIIGSYFIIPFFMKLKVISAYEILEKPLGVEVRKIASVIFLVTRIVWMALLIYLASKAMVVMMGWDDQVIFLITVILGLITIVYTTMGGLKAVLLTDVIQFVILLLGAVMTIGMVANQFGGVRQLIPTTWAVHWPQIDVVNFNPYVRLTVFFAFVNAVSWWVCTTGSDQMAIQRFISTKNLKAARTSFAVTQAGSMVMTLLLLFVGFSVMKFYSVKPNLLPTGIDVTQDADFLFPHFIANQFPMGMSGLVIAALFSASMSSLSSGINSTSSVLAIDLFPHILNKEKGTLTSVRISSAVVGVLVVLISLIIPYVPGNIIEVTAKTNGLFIAPLFNLFFMALFVKSMKPFSVVMGSVHGLFAAFTVAFWNVLTDNPPWSFLWILITSLIFAITSTFILNSLFKNANRSQKKIWSIVSVLPWIMLYILL